MINRKLVTMFVALALGLAACGGGSARDEPAPQRPEDRSIDDVLGEDPEREDRVVDAYAEWTRCIAADEVPNAECPNPAGGANPPDEAPSASPTEAEINAATVMDLYSMYGAAPSGSDLEARIEAELTERGEFGWQ